MSGELTVLAAADLADRLSDPEWCEAPLTDGDNPLTPVLIGGDDELSVLNGEQRLVPWRLLVGLYESAPVGEAPACLDIALCEGEERPGWVAVRELEPALESLTTVAGAQPVASGVLAQLTRLNEDLAPEHALIAESLAYSGLLAGSEFRRWREANPARPTPDASSPVRIDWDDGAMVIRLNRPEVRNAYDPAMRDALTDALRAVAALPEHPVVHLEGNGPDFCSGGDLSWFGSAQDVMAAHAVRTARSPGPLLAQLGAVARVHGACVGAGAELPAFCARVVAEPSAWFQLPEIGMGLIPGAGGTVSLLARIGRHRLNWLALSGERLHAARALDWSLLDSIVD